jgi:hypothetical protein|tara:strand:- start:3927 stop:4181 length:255 start_codon:yes stop_codon:yes gene_type:complete
MNDWLDDILDGEPTGITDTQWLIIESNIHRTALPPHYVDDVMERLNDLTELEAEEIIKQINENKIETDTRKQWLKMLKDGVFDK